MELPSEVRLAAPPAAEITGAQQALKFAQSIVVANPEQYGLAATELKGIKARFDRIEDARKKMKGPILEAGRQIDRFFDAALEPLREAEKVVKGTMLTYQQAEDRRAAEARRKHEEEVRAARLEAERKADEARKKAEAEAQRQREEAERRASEAAEAKRKAEEARAAGDREAAEKAELARRNAEAAERVATSKATAATEKGERQASAAMEKAAEAAAKPAPVQEEVKVAGTSVRSTWKARVVDLKTLIDAVAAGKAPMACLQVDQKVLDRAAVSLRDELTKFYPGVEPVETKGLAVSARG